MIVIIVLLGDDSNDNAIGSCAENDDGDNDA